MKEKVVIIGGGMGGLFTGAFLALHGTEVTVLEKNAIIGGGLQCFSRGDVIFETGMHIMGGFYPGGTLDRICRYLGIRDLLDIHHIDSDCSDEILCADQGRVFRIPAGREKFVERLSGYFPQERRGITAYVDELYRLADEVPMFYLRHNSEQVFVHSDSFFIPADTLISRYIRNEDLRNLLAYLNPLYGGVPGHTPAYIHALINVLYINGASRFAGGSQQLADALARVISEHGGKVLAGKEVDRINVESKKAVSVRTSDNEIFTADKFVWAAHPSLLTRTVTPGSFTRAFTGRVEAMPLTLSAFTLFIALKPGTTEYIDHTCYYVDSLDNIWATRQTGGIVDGSWPKGFMYMTPPDARQGQYASRMIVHCVMDFADVERWKDTTVGRRGAEYDSWKDNLTNRIIDRLESIMPGIRDSISKVWSASPLTVRDYFGTPRGAIFGNRKDCEDILATQMSVYTKIGNLYLTGQNVNLHGICGVPLTAISTAEAVLGRSIEIPE